MIAVSGLAFVGESALPPASCDGLPPFIGVSLWKNRVNGDPVAPNLDLVTVQEEVFSTLPGKLFFTGRKVGVPGRTPSIGLLTAGVTAVGGVITFFASAVEMTAPSGWPVVSTNWLKSSSRSTCGVNSAGNLFSSREFLDCSHLLITSFESVWSS